MKEPSLLQRIIWAIDDIPDTLRRMFCHHSIETMFTAETFTVDKWERCSGTAECIKCGATFHIYIPANESEKQPRTTPNQTTP